MKEFSQWVADMAGSIEDKSEFTKSSLSTNTQTAPLTDLQKRLHIADLLVTNPQTEDDIHSWVMAFCIAYKASDDEFFSEFFYKIAGEDIAGEYYITANDGDAKEWLKDFRQQVLDGKIK